MFENKEIKRQIDLGYENMTLACLFIILYHFYLKHCLIFKPDKLEFQLKY